MLRFVDTKKMKEGNSTDQVKAIPAGEEQDAVIPEQVVQELALLALTEYVPARQLEQVLFAKRKAPAVLI